jgi:hypothetical protein
LAIEALDHPMMAIAVGVGTHAADRRGAGRGVLRPAIAVKDHPVDVAAGGGGGYLQRCDHQGRVVMLAHGVAEHPP